MRIESEVHFMLVVHNGEIARLVKDRYELQDIHNISELLHQKKVFQFPSLENGLFPAAIVAASTEYTGYSAVWIRDNIYVAYAHYLTGQVDIALKTVSCLMQYFRIHKARLEKIINHDVDPNNVMERPHVRFNGEHLSEIDQSWEHAQNDALGYFLWFCCNLIRDEVFHPTQEDIEILALFPRYFEAIAYWQDEDSGHWEESRKIEASSIGVVIAGLRALQSIAMKFSFSTYGVTAERLDVLIRQGVRALTQILPSECIQVGRERRYDSALLFLIYPLAVVDETMGDQIINDVINNLQGYSGIPRYLGDSFWCRNYADIPETIRTSISTDREQWLSENERSLQPGEEAQWCIFDPVISTIFGMKFQKTGQIEFLEKQTLYLNRSLGQITANDCKAGGFKCPELYYLKGAVYIPNDATPLLWTQANLRIALNVMECSLSKKSLPSQI
jgi:hypothetical protein